MFAGPRSLGIGVDRNVSLDEESAASSEGIADGLEPASEREYADLDRMAPKGKSYRVQRLFESLEDTFRRRAPTASKGQSRGDGQTLVRTA